MGDAEINPPPVVAKKKRKWWSMRWWVVVFGVLPLLTCLGSPFVLIASDMYSATGSRNIARYEKYRRVFSSDENLKAHIPTRVPANAVGARMFAIPYTSFLGPTPTRFELRVLVSQAEAERIADDAKAIEAALNPNVDASGLALQLGSAADEDALTPLPAGYETYIVTVSGPDLGAITINRSIGEVIYWCYDD